MTVTVAPSFNDLLDQGLAEAQSRRPDLSFAEGDITEAMLHASGTMADASIRFAGMKFRETFLDGASGQALDTLVSDRYGLNRHPATAAQVSVTFTRASTVQSCASPVVGRQCTMVKVRGLELANKARHTAADAFIAIRVALHPRKLIRNRTFEDHPVGKVLHLS